MNQNLYEILGVSPYSSTDEIKRAYKRLARVYHPDINREEYAEEIFKKITYAHSVLSDPKKRLLYDSTYIGRKIYGLINLLSPLIKSLIRLRIRDATTELKDILYNLNTTLVDVFIEEGEIPRDTEKQIIIRETANCPKCYGFNRNCKTCMGSGKVSTYKKKMVKIRAFSSIKGRVRTQQYGKNTIFKKRFLLNIQSKRENLSISKNGITIGVVLNKDTKSRRLNFEFMGKLFEINLPEKISENTVLRLKKLIMGIDVNLNIRQEVSEKNRCVG